MSSPFQFSYEVMNTFIAPEGENRWQGGLLDVEYSDVCSCPGDFAKNCCDDIMPVDSLDDMDADSDELESLPSSPDDVDFQGDQESTPRSNDNKPTKKKNRTIPVVGCKVWYNSVDPGYVCDIAHNALLVRFGGEKYWISNGHWSLRHSNTEARLKLRLQPKTGSLSRRQPPKAPGLPGRGDLRRANKQAQSSASSSQATSS